MLSETAENSDLRTMLSASKAMVTPGPSLDRLILKDVCRFLTLQRPRLKAKASGLSIVMELYGEGNLRYAALTEH